MSTTRPLLLGYRTLRLDSSPDAAENGRRLLAAFAEREGFTLDTIYTEHVMCPGPAFEALLQAVATGHASAVAIPTPDDLGRMPRIRDFLRARLRDVGGVSVLTVQSFTPAGS